MEYADYVLLFGTLPRPFLSYERVRERACHIFGIPGEKIHGNLIWGASSATRTQMVSHRGCPSFVSVRACRPSPRPL